MKSRIPELDGIRGLAIIMVVIYHYGYLSLDAKASCFNAYFRLFTKYFNTGVDLFFVLSGFLLGGILLANKEKANYFRPFYFRRICRIFPIYFLSILGVFIIYQFGIGAGTNWAATGKVPLYSYLFFIQNFFMMAHGTFGSNFLVVTWSLAVEEQFYLILPFLIYFLNRKWLIAVLCACVVSAPFFRHNAANFFASFGMVYCRFDSLFTGVLIAIAVRNTAFAAFCNRYSAILGSFLVLLFGISLLFTLRIVRLDPNNVNTWFSFVWSFFILVIATGKGSLFSSLMRSRFLILAGKYSFGIYIYHYMILGLSFFILTGKEPEIKSLNDVLATISSLILTVVISYASFHYFEKKIIAFGHRFKY